MAQRTRLQPDFNIFTVEQDVELGRRAASELEANSAILQNASVTGYLNSLGRSLAAKAPGSNPFQFQLKIIDEKAINAFGAPGGIVYMNRGTIEAAANEAQLASVVAHEISHVVLRHGSHQLSKAYVLQGPFSNLRGLGRTSVADALAKTSGSFTAGSIVVKNSLEAENQADVLGVQIVYDAGYDPMEALRFFEIVENRSESAQLPQNHPETSRRIVNVAREIEKLGAVQANVIVDSIEFQNIKAVLRSGVIHRSHQ